MTNEKITAACKKHGAKAVSDAAYAAMGGKRSGLEKLELPIYGVGNLYAATKLAYELMTPTEQAKDLAGAVIAAAKI